MVIGTPDPDNSNAILSVRTFSANGMPNKSAPVVVGAAATFASPAIAALAGGKMAVAWQDQLDVKISALECGRKPRGGDQNLVRRGVWSIIRSGLVR